MTIGDKLKELRNDKGITQRQLAKEINYSPSYIGDLENNRTNPSVKILEVFANYFNVDVGYFFDNNCCYVKYLSGKEDFCYCKEQYCNKCPLKSLK